MKKAFSRLLRFLTLLFILLFLILGIAYIFRFTIDLSSIKNTIEKSASFSLGREVNIEGAVTFEVSHLLALHVQDIHIQNIPDGLYDDFFKAKDAYLEFGLLPLLKGELHFNEIIAKEVILNLENTIDTDANWIFQKRSNAITKQHTMSFKGVESLSFENITLKYHDASLNKTIETHLDKLSGAVAPGKRIVFTLDGKINQVPFHIDLEGFPIEQLIDKKQLWAFKLNGDFAQRKIASRGSFKYGDLPEIQMKLDINDLDIGGMLSKLGILNDISAMSPYTSLRFILKGNSLREILEKSTVYLDIKEAKWQFALLQKNKQISIDRINSSVSVIEGGNLTIALTGDINNEPLKVKITGTPLVDFVEKPEKLPIGVDVAFAKMLLDLQTVLTLPIGTKVADLSLKLQGERLDALNDFFKLDLPSLGPFDVESKLTLSEKKYDFTKLHIDVGDTTLQGNMRLDLGKKIPVVDMNLISERIQINDFVFKKNIKNVPKVKGEKLRQLLSGEVLSSLEAKVDIEAKEILSGKDKIGAVASRIYISNSRLKVDPLRIHFPGGLVAINFGFLPQKDNAVIDLKADIDKFDIGILARRSKPGTDMGGTLYLDTELHATTPTIKDMLKHAKGHFYFGVIPKNFSAKTIDLWAVNLILTIINRETAKDASQVNCFIMRFGMDDGLMKDKIVYMDTSTMTVTGKAAIDFKKESINVIMAPKAKKPNFFSLEVPIKIEGTFQDFGLKLSKSGLLGSVISFIASPVIVPIKRALVDELPKDGKNACIDAWNYVELRDEKPLYKSVHEKHLKLLEGD